MSYSVYGRLCKKYFKNLHVFTFTSEKKKLCFERIKRFFPESFFSLITIELLLYVDNSPFENSVARISSSSRGCIICTERVNELSVVVNISTSYRIRDRRTKNAEEKNKNSRVRPLYYEFRYPPMYSF